MNDSPAFTLSPGEGRVSAYPTNASRDIQEKLMRRLAAVVVLAASTFLSSLAFAADPTTTVNVWPAKAPGETQELPPEADMTKPTAGTPGGKRVTRIGNVSTPTLAIYRAPKDKDTGASVIICPGGGHSILAYDHEGTEVAEFLNTLGVTGIVLKYRVPARDPNKRYLAAVQDAQRAVSLVRSKAKEWELDPGRIGILGFSAGGEVAGLTALFHDQRQYDAIDNTDKTPCRPDFAALIYPAYLVQRPENAKLQEYVSVTKQTPPMFLVHAYNDGIHPFNSMKLFEELKKAGVAAELHIYSTGGHGFGMRDNKQPVNTWPDRCADWLRISGYLKK